jgi:parallel beta-helix repeat protein
MPRSRTAISARILHCLATFSVVLLAGSSSPIVGSSPAAAARQERMVARAAGRMLPRPVGLLPDSNYAIPDGAVFVSRSGNDGWEGTERRPLKSLTAAVSRVDPNGTIVMRAGNYPESVPVIRKQVTIQPYPHEQVWMKGSDVLTRWTRVGDDWRADGWVSPFCHTCFHPEAIDPAYPLAGLPEQVFVDGEPLRQVDTLWGVTSRTFYIEPVTRHLYIGRDPTDARVEVSSRWRALQLDPEAAGSVIRGIGFSDYSPHWNVDQLGAVIVNAPLVRIEGNAFTRNAGTGLAVVNQPYVAVTGNVVASNGYRGMNMYMSHNSVVRQNRFENNNTERFANSGCGNACTVAGLKAVQMHNLVVDNNDFRDNWGAGVWCDLACTDTAITDNMVSGNFGTGVFFEISSGGVIAGNFINHNARDANSTTAAGVKVAGSEDVVIFGNVFAGNVRQLGVYDDPRSPEGHLYSRYLGLTWDTARVTVAANHFYPDEGTTDLLATNATATVAAPDMFAGTESNIVGEPESQRFYWTTAEGEGHGYGSLSAFEQATGRDFGS